MGTPRNSAIAKRALEEFYLAGDLPSYETLVALGIDVKLLELRHTVMKEVLAKLEGWEKIEADEHCLFHHARFTKTWDRLVAEAGLAGERVLRFTRDDKYGLFHFHGSEVVEVFIARNGDWIIWSGGVYSPNPDQFISARFTRYKSTRTMLRELKRLVFSRRHPALELNEGLVQILRKNVEAKQERLTTLSALLKEFEQADRDGGLVD